MTCPIGIPDPKMAALGSTNSSDLELLRSGCSALCCESARVSVYSALRAEPAYKQGVANGAYRALPIGRAGRAGRYQQSKASTRSI